MCLSQLNGPRMTRTHPAQRLAKRIENNKAAAHTLKSYHQGVATAPWKTLREALCSTRRSLSVEEEAAGSYPPRDSGYLNMACLPDRAGKATFHPML